MPTAFLYPPNITPALHAGQRVRGSGMESKTLRPRRVLIIGAGFGGIACAKALSKNPRFTVTLVERTNHHLFQPLLYQVATSSLAAPDIACSVRQIFRDSNNVTVLMDEILELGIESKNAVGVSGDSYPWDYLVLATGAKTSFFGHPEWEQHTLGLKSLADAQGIRRQVLSSLEKAERTTDPSERKQLMTVAIVGGGPTGVELSGAFVDLVHRSMKGEFRRINTSDLRVILIEAANRLLTPYDEDQSAYAKERLETLGVEVWTERMVRDVGPAYLEFTDGERLEASTIIWAAGIEANPIAGKLGVEPADRSGRITPERDLSVPGHTDVFIIGDIVRMNDIDDKPVPGVAPAAVQMGDHVAKVLKEELRLEKTRYDGKKHELRPGFRYFDKGLMAIIGKNAAVVKSGKLRLRGFLAWVAWLFIHILFLIGFRNKLVVLLGWGFAYIRNNPGVRVIVNPPADASSQGNSR